ncbi:hypothetical protein V5F77_20175 [Xanthobacter sp. DSM 24535]|uniref:hypothetical protein n=1 Tax=Roseixanthobacter psychrophilus TaxID=3119917 RepID=UPI003728949B
MHKPALLLAAALMLFSSAASAETRIFLIENSDAYGVDMCLANGERCGEQVATAWCRTHNYSRALDFGRVADASGIVPIASTQTPRAVCTGSNCPAVVAITCTR